MSEEHTPLPWAFEDGIYPHNGYFVITAEGMSARSPLATVNQLGDKESARADTAFIVQAVNSHAALVEALKPLARHADAIDQHFTAEEMREIDQETHLVATGISVADCFRARAALSQSGDSTGKKEGEV